MKRSLAYIAAAWRGDRAVDMEQAAHYCRVVYDAVSYTHLDVYKRQHIELPPPDQKGELFNVAIWENLKYRNVGNGYIPEEAENTLNAVSYTHLDVYKRQQ